jgi:hypothetical protein
MYASDLLNDIDYFETYRRRDSFQNADDENLLSEDSMLLKLSDLKGLLIELKHDTRSP